MSAESPALVADVASRLAAGWTFALDDRTLTGVWMDEDGLEHSVAITCPTAADAAALLEAAQAR